MARSLKAIEKEAAALDAASRLATKVRATAGRSSSTTKRGGGKAKPAARGRSTATKPRKSPARRAPTRKVAGVAKAQRSVCIPANSEFRLEVWDTKARPHTKRAARKSNTTKRATTKKTTRKRRKA